MHFLELFFALSQTTQLAVQTHQVKITRINATFQQLCLNEGQAVNVPAELIERIERINCNWNDVCCLADRLQHNEIRDVMTPGQYIMKKNGLWLSVLN